MDHLGNLNQRNSDHCNLTGLAWRMICETLEKRLGRKLDRWKGPEITHEDRNGGYKLDWCAPDDLTDMALAGEYLTVYDDGIWQFYGKDGQIEGRILRFHDRRWIDRMVKAGVLGQIAWFSVQFFKRLKEKVK